MKTSRRSFIKKNTAAVCAATGAFALISSQLVNADGEESGGSTSLENCPAASCDWIYKCGVVNGVYCCCQGGINSSNVACTKKVTKCRRAENGGVETYEVDTTIPAGANYKVPATCPVT